MVYLILTDGLDKNTVMKYADSFRLGGVDFRTVSCNPTRTVKCIGGDIIVADVTADKVRNTADMLIFPTKNDPEANVKISAKRIKYMADFINKSSCGKNPAMTYRTAHFRDNTDSAESDSNVNLSSDDNFLRCVDIAITNGSVTASEIASELGICSRKATWYVLRMEKYGIVNKPDSDKRRKTLIDRNTFIDMLNSREI